jgi:hypothetical protein
MRANADESNKKLLQEMNVLHEMISTLTSKVSNLSNQPNSKSENVTRIPYINNALLTNFKFNKSNALFYFSKSAVS